MVKHTWHSLAALATLAVLAPAQTPITVTAAPGQVQIEPGRSVAAWLYDGQLPGPTLRVTEGQRLRVKLVNRLPKDTTIHWHGVPLPSGMDGVPGVSRPAVAPGQEFTYDFTAGPAGTYFFHPHVELQLDQGLYGVLIVDPSGPGDPPYDRELIVVLDDLLIGLPVPGRDPTYSDYLLNGKTSLGQTPLIVQPNDRVRVRFINASAFTSYAVAIDGHPMAVTHADGRRVQPVTVQALPIGPGERWDVLVQATNPGTWSLAAADLGARGTTLVRAILQYAGSTQQPPPPSYVPPWLRSGTLLAYSQLASAEPVPPISASPDRTHALTLGGGMMSYVWTINGQAWPNASALPVVAQEDVRLRFSNQSMMHHPMHLHGHFFRLLGTAGGTTAPPQKDTILLQPSMMGPSVDVELVADNPGAWMLHCHNLYHAEAGMMRLVQYVNGDADSDGLQDGVDLDPLSAYPAGMTDALGGGYRVGAPFEVQLQWPSGERAQAFAGLELDPPLALGPLGQLALAPPLLLDLGSATAGSDLLARVQVAVPARPDLVGARIGLQGIATHATLPPLARLSTLAVVTLQP